MICAQVDAILFDTADTLEHMCAQLPPAGPMTRTDALDAGAARKEAYEEAA